jgi:hypothetical protein
MHPCVRAATILLCAMSLHVQGLAQTNPPAQAGPIDACGVLVQGAECVLLEVSGGRYVLADYGRYRVGDEVRVIGTINPNCVTICNEGDGCIAGAVLYDPNVFPCGSGPVVPPFDPCAAISAGLTMALAGGLLLAPRRR